MKTKLTAAMVPVYLIVCAAMLLATAAGNRAVTVMAESAPIEGRLCIIIDAGHGDPDGGAVSCTGVFESGINLEISRRLEDLLRLLGYDTLMTRITESSVYTSGDTIGEKKVSDLKERARMVNAVENGVLLSIHQNHYTDSRYSGAQMFWANTQGSKELAETLQGAFAAHLNPGSNRAAKKCQGIWLMEHVDCPAVLVECGFLSNTAEEAKLRDSEYQKRICCVIVSALSEFISNT